MCNEAEARFASSNGVDLFFGENKTKTREAGDAKGDKNGNKGDEPDKAGGYPGGAGPHCEGCGRDLVAPCARCEAPRRVGTEHCAVCGQI